eukprot:UN08179
MQVEEPSSDDAKTEQGDGTLLQQLPHHIVGFIGSFIDIFDLYSMMKTSKTMYTFFQSENNTCTMKSCIRNVFDDEWLRLALTINNNNISKAIQWLYQDTLIYRQCHSYKTTMDARNVLLGRSINDLTIANTPKRYSEREIIGRLVTGTAANILLQRKNENLFHLSSLHSQEPIVVLFRNGSATHNRTIRWIWIDSDGRDIDYTSTTNNIINPNRAIFQPSFPSHPWKIIDPTKIIVV